MMELVKDFAICVIILLARVSFVIAERESSNAVALEIPSVLLLQLYSLRGRKFPVTSKAQIPRLRIRLSSAQNKDIKQNFQKLQSAYIRESTFKAVPNTCDRHTLLENGWNLAQHCFVKLWEFRGGLAKAFLGTCQRKTTSKCSTEKNITTESHWKTSLPKAFFVQSSSSEYGPSRLKKNWTYEKYSLRDRAKFQREPILTAFAALSGA